MNNPKKFLELLVDFEMSHDVDSYMVDGWHVWPLLRNAIAWNFYSDVCSPVGQNKIRVKIYGAIKKIFSKIIESYYFGSTEFKKSDIVFITNSPRRVDVDGISYEIYSDPMVELCKKNNLDCVVLENGSSLKKQKNKSINFQKRLRNQVRLIKKLRSDSCPPSWFNEYQILASTVMGRLILWDEVIDLISTTTARSNVFERWLKEINPNILFCVCWFDPISMACIMAAKRLNIRTIEIQHGVQGINHPGYAFWQKHPETGYETLPEIFWEWGIRSAEEIIKNNPKLPRSTVVIPGGNLWLNFWRDKKYSKPQSNYKNEHLVILVVLQLDPPLSLIEEIKTCQHQWRWIIRFHPARSMKMRDEDKNKFVGHNISFENPESSHVYQAIKNADCVVTEASAVAIEALGIGAKVVILGDSELGEIAREAYKFYLSSGAMILANKDKKLPDAIMQAIYGVRTSNMLLEFSDKATSEVAFNQILGFSQKYDGAGLS